MSLNRFKRTVIKLDKANNRIPQVMLGKEGDYYGRELEVHLLDDGERVDTTGVDLNFQWKNLKSGEFGALPFEEEDAAKGTYVVAYPPEMLTKGDASCAVQIVEGGSTTHTMNFKVSVEGNPLDSEVLMKDNSFKALGEALVKINSLKQQFDDAVGAITEDSEVILARDGFPTLGERLNSQKEDYANQHDLKIKNEIVNGDFSNGLVDWIRYGSTASVSVVNGQLKIFYSDTNFTDLGVRQDVNNGKVGDKLYVRFDFMGNFENALTVRIVDYGTSNGNISIIGNSRIEVGDYSAMQTKSTIWTLDRDKFTFTHFHYGGYANYIFDNYIIINLTQTFGAGNEPTKEEMDELMKIIPNGWFDGELTLSQKQIATWQLNLIRQNRNAIISLGGTIV